MQRHTKLALFVSYIFCLSLFDGVFTSSLLRAEEGDGDVKEESVIARFEEIDQAIRELLEVLPGNEHRADTIGEQLIAAETHGLALPQVFWLIGSTGTGKTEFIQRFSEMAGIPTDRLHIYGVTSERTLVFDFSKITEADPPTDGTNLQGLFFFDETLQLKHFRDLDFSEAVARADMFLSLDVLLGSGRHRITGNAFIRGAGVHRTSEGDPFAKVAELLVEAAKLPAIDEMKANHLALKEQIEAVDSEIGQIENELVVIETQGKAKLLHEKDEYERWEVVHKAWQDRRKEHSDRQDQYARERDRRERGNGGRGRSRETREANFDREDEEDRGSPLDSLRPPPAFNEPEPLFHLLYNPMRVSWEDYVDKNHLAELRRRKESSSKQKETLTRNWGQQGLGGELEAALKKAKDIEDRLTLFIGDLRRYFGKLLNYWMKKFKIPNGSFSDNRRLARWMMTNHEALSDHLKTLSVPEEIELPRNNIILVFAGNPNEILDDAKLAFANSTEEKNPDLYRSILARVATPQRTQKEVAEHLGLDPQLLRERMNHFRSEGHESASLERLLNGIHAIRTRYGIDSLQFELPPSGEDYRRVIGILLKKKFSEMSRLTPGVEAKVEFSQAFMNWFVAEITDPIGAYRKTLGSNFGMVAQKIATRITRDLGEFKTPGASSVRNIVVQIDLKFAASSGTEQSVVNLTYREPSTRNTGEPPLKTSEVSILRIAKNWEVRERPAAQVGATQLAYHQAGHIFTALMEFRAVMMDSMDWMDFSSTQRIGYGTIFPDEYSEYNINYRLALMRTLLGSVVAEEHYDRTDDRTIIQRSEAATEDIQAAKRMMIEMVLRAKSADLNPQGSVDGRTETRSSANLNRILDQMGIFPNETDSKLLSYQNSDLAVYLFERLLTSLRDQFRLHPRLLDEIARRMLESDGNRMTRDQLIEILNATAEDGRYLYHRFSPEQIREINNRPSGSVLDFQTKVGTVTPVRQLIGDCAALLEEVGGKGAARSVGDFLDELIGRLKP